MTPPSVADLTWTQEQARWRDYHARHVEARLAWVESRIGRELAALAEHCASLLALLDQARGASWLHDRLINLILALDPWPIRWGYGPAWEALLRFGSEAAARMGDERRHLRLLHALANCYFASGRADLARRTAQRTLEAALRIGLLDIVVGALDLVVFVALRQGETAAAQRLLAQVAGQLSDADWTHLPDMARLCFSYARILRRIGQLEDALAWADRAVRLVEHALANAATGSETSLLADACNVRGVMYWATARYEQARRDLERALAGYARSDDRLGVSRVRGTLGLVYWSQGNLEPAEAIFLEAMRQAEEQNNKWGQAVTIGNLGLVELCRGRLRQAMARFVRQISLAEKIGDQHEAMRGLGNRGIARLHRGDLSGAMADLKIEQEFGERSGQPEGLICNYVTQVRCLAALRQAAEARALAERTLAQAREIGSRALIIMALRCLAEQMDGREARTALAEALYLAQQTGRRLDEAACLLALASLTVGQEQRLTWYAGTQILKEIGAAAWLRGCSPQKPPRIVLIA